MIECTKIDVMRHRGVLGKPGKATLRVFETDDAQDPIFEAMIVGLAGGFIELLTRYACELADRRVE